MNRRAKLSTYRQMLTARQIDKVSREMTQRGEAFFHLSSQRTTVGPNSDADHRNHFGNLRIHSRFAWRLGGIGRSVWLGNLRCCLK